MAKNKIYTSFVIHQVNDIDGLISLIKTKGNFQLEDYYKFKRQAKKTLQPSRIIRRLNKEVYPLIGFRIQPIVEPQEVSKPLNDDTTNSFWEKDYKASDFTLSDGIITIGKYHLKTVRVRKTHPSWLADIDHIFHIARDSKKKGNKGKNEFHFVPYTDLSFLLNDIQRQQKEQNRLNKLKRIREEWREKLFSYLHITSISTNEMSFTTKTLKELDLYVDNSSKVFLWDTTNNYVPNISIPMADVKVEDGKISVSTVNVAFSQQPYYRYNNYGKWNSSKEILYPSDKEYIETPSWNGFLELLMRVYDNFIIKDSISEFKERYLNETTGILESLRKQDIISFDTYQSRNGFLQRNTGDYLHLFLNNNLGLCYPIKYLYRWTNNDLGLISDEFNYSESSLKKIAEIIDDNWKIIKKHSNWLLTNILPTVNKAEKPINKFGMINLIKITPQSELRVVTDYYEGRLHIPNGWKCKDSIVTFFTENASHCSDDWSKSTEMFRTFMIWSKDENEYRIFMIPTNEKYSSYRFYVNTSECSLEVASYVIWRYFTSNMDNKRQGFQPKEIFKLFGIYRLQK